MLQSLLSSPHTNTWKPSSILIFHTEKAANLKIQNVKICKSNCPHFGQMKDWELTVSSHGCVIYLNFDMQILSKHFPFPFRFRFQLRNSSDSQVMLKRVTLQSSGLYRCEVSGEAPAFNTVSESETMTVVGKSKISLVNAIFSHKKWGSNKRRRKRDTDRDRERGWRMYLRHEKQQKFN